MIRKESQQKLKATNDKKEEKADKKVKVVA